MRQSAEEIAGEASGGGSRWRESFLFEVFFPSRSAPPPSLRTSCQEPLHLQRITLQQNNGIIELLTLMFFEACSPICSMIRVA